MGCHRWGRASRKGLHTPEARSGQHQPPREKALDPRVKESACLAIPSLLVPHSQRCKELQRAAGHGRGRHGAGGWDRGDLGSLSAHHSHAAPARDAAVSQCQARAGPSPHLAPAAKSRGSASTAWGHGSRTGSGGGRRHAPSSKCGVCRERAGGFCATWVHHSLVEASASGQSTADTSRIILSTTRLPRARAVSSEPGHASRKATATARVEASA